MAKVRTCSNPHCKEINPQPLENFYKKKKCPEGRQARCKTCHAISCLPYQKIWKKKNAKRLSQETIARSNKNREVRRAYSNLYAKMNPEIPQACSAKRRARKLERTPKWLTKDDFRFIQKFYEESTKLTKETGIRHDVDHIIPLKGKYMSGLHVPWNLRILIEIDNLSRPRNIEPFIGKEPFE